MDSYTKKKMQQQLGGEDKPVEEKLVTATVRDEEGQAEEYEVVAYPSFDTMKLKDELLRGVFGYGFDKPSLIQQNAIVPLAEGRDIIAQAQSGTGKTGTFTIGILQLINAETKDPAPQALILAPTVPLAKQIAGVVKCLGIHLDIKVCQCVGGTRVSDTIVELQRGCHVVVGTPGRVMHMIDEGVLQTSRIKVLVMDEADEMLSQGFEDMVRTIFGTLPTDVQVALFSATLPEEVLCRTDRFMRKPINILVKKEELTLRGITQFYVDCEHPRHKFETLAELYTELNIAQSVIFVNSKRGVDQLQEDMTRDNFTVSCIHSGLTPEQKDEVMMEFRLGKSRVLISTDLIARGIDVHSVSVVINYDMPRSRENYLHRVGRGGRFGKKGLAISLIAGDNDKRALRDLEKYYDTFVDPMPTNVATYL